MPNSILGFNTDDIEIPKTPNHNLRTVDLSFVNLSEYITDPDKFAKMYEEEKDEIKIAARKIADKLNISYDVIDPLFEELLNKHRLTIYQLRMLFNTMSYETNSITGKRLINVIDAPTGSGKTFLQQFIMTHTHLIYGKKTPFSLIMSGPTTIQDVLDANVRYLCECIITKNHYVKKQLRDSKFCWLIHYNQIKKLSTKNKKVIDDQVYKGNMYIFGKNEKQDMIYLPRFYKKHDKIITICATNYLLDFTKKDNKVVKRVLSYIADVHQKFKVKMFFGDEAHKESHTIGAPLISLNVSMTTNQYSDKTERIYGTLLSMDYTMSFFSGTSSKQQRTAPITVKNAQKLIDSRQIYLNDGKKPEHTSYHSYMKIKEKEFKDDVKRGKYDIFNFYGLNNLEKTIVASRNASLHTIINMVDVMEDVAKEQNKKLEHTVYILNNNQIGDCTIEDIDLYDIINNPSKYTSPNFSGESGKVKAFIPHISQINEDIWGTKTVIFNQFYIEALKRVVQQKSFDKDGLSLFKLASKNRLNGMTLDNYIEFINKHFPDKKDNILIYTSTTHRLLSSDDDDQFSDQSITDVLENNKSIKQILTIDKLSVGNDISNITSIFMMRKQQAKNGEYLNPQQQIGRGVRAHKEPLDIICFTYGKQEAEIMDMILNTQKTIAPVEIHKLISNTVKDTIPTANNILTDDIIFDVKNQYKEFYDMLLKDYITYQVELNLKILKNAKKYSNNTITDKDIHESFGSIADSMSKNSEKYMPDFIKDSVRQGGLLDSDIKLLCDGRYYKLDFKYCVTDNYKPKGIWSLKGEDRTDGVLHTGVLFLLINIFIDNDGDYKTTAYLVEFSDETIKSISEKKLIKGGKGFIAHKIM